MLATLKTHCILLLCMVLCPVLVFSFFINTAQKNTVVYASPAQYTVSQNKFYKNGENIVLKGVNWFGFETFDYVFHGLWQKNYNDVLDQMQSLGFNAVRIPFCPGTLRTDVYNQNFVSGLNPDLAGKSNLELFDYMLGKINERGMYILLDHHRPDCNAISELWYTPSYSESQWIQDLQFVANRYKNLAYFMGLDIKNEPHGAAKWGTGNPANDWKLAAEKAGEAVLAVNPNILIFVEGIGENDGDCSSTTSHWWGGNLEPLNCYPLSTQKIPANKLVLAPHVYGPDVFNQSYFQTQEFPQNMPSIWDTQVGFALDTGYTLAIGEFGGKYGGGLQTDITWQNAWIDYMIGKKICNFFFWSWNPNSGDTGGLVQNDWTTVETGKYNNLKRLMDSSGCQPHQVQEPVNTDVSVDISVMLGGSASENGMRATLFDKQLIPTSQPFNDNVYFYGGNESFSYQSMPVTVVDWVLVLAYDNQGTFIESKAGLVRIDGHIIHPSNTALRFTQLQSNQSYRFRILHKNHIGISTDGVYSSTNGSIAINLKDRLLVKGQNLMQSGSVYVMRPANVNSDTSLDSADRNALRIISEQAGVYSSYDINMDGNVDAQDRNMMRQQIESVEEL